MNSKKSENKNSKFNKEILNYLSDNLSQEDRYTFEKQLHEDDFDFDAMEGFEDFNIEEIIEDKKILEHQIIEKTSKKKRVLYYQIAGIAAVGIIFIFLANLFFFQDLAEKKEMISEEVQTDHKETASEIDVPPELPDQKAQKLIEKEESNLNEEITDENIEIVDGDEVLEEIYFEDEKQPVAEMPEEDVLEVVLPDMEVEVAEGVKNVEENLEPVPETEKRFMAPTTSRSAVKKSTNTNIVTKEKQIKDGNFIIKGKVVDSTTDEPLPGVNIVLEGAMVGTMTDINGDFKIEVPVKYADKTLKVNYIGFLTEQIPVTQDTSLVVGLVEDIVALDEVVVVGYGANKKTNQTGSVSIVEMPDGNAPVEIAAQPVMGYPEFRDYLKENIKIPESLPKGKTEKVKIKITIHRDGQIRRVDVISSPGDEFSDEAVRLLVDGPEWQAKTVNGKAETSEVVLRIKFKR